MRFMVLQLSKGNFFPLNIFAPVAVSKKRVRARRLHALVGTDMDKVFKVKKIEQGEILLEDVTQKSFLKRVTEPQKIWCSTKNMDTHSLKAGTVFSLDGYNGNQLKVNVIMNLN